MRNFGICILAYFICLPCNSITLGDAMNAAYSKDTQLQSARFALDAALKESDIGLSYLLPTLSAGGKMIKSTGVTDLDQNTVTGTSNYSSSNDYLSKSTTLTLRQPIFDMERLALFNQGELKTLIGQEQYQAEEQNFYSRLIENYFNVLKLQNEIFLVDAQQRTLESLVKQTSRLYQAGEGTVTDIDEAQARLDLIISQRIDLSAQLQNSRRELSNQIGEWPDDMSRVTDRIPPDSIFQSHEDSSFWQNIAYKKSPVLAARTAAVSLAKATLQQQKAGHYPKLAIAGQLSQLNVDQANSNQERNDKTIALTIDIPLYAGGGVSAYSQKALSLLKKTQFDLDSAKQQLSLDVERNYLGVTSGINKCKALYSALKSNNKALISAERGFDAGTRPVIDILNAQERSFSTKRDFINTKLSILLDLVKLKVAVGEMNAEQVKQIELLL